MLRDNGSCVIPVSAFPTVGYRAVIPLYVVRDIISLRDTDLRLIKLCDTETD